jgi:hypothetical protein
MSTDISMQTTKYQVGDRSWLLATPDYKPNVTLDVSKFSASAVNEIQTVTITGTPTGGTFTLSYKGQTTTAIAYNAAAAAVQAALQALSTIGSGNATVSGSAGGPYTVTFVGALAGINVDQLGAVGSFTGGSSPAVAVVTATPGQPAPYVNGFIPSGTVIGLVTATGLFGPYTSGASDGTQTAYGLTYGDVRVIRQNGSVATKVGTGAVVYDAAVSVSKLPFQTGPGSIDSAAKTALAQLRFEA